MHRPPSPRHPPRRTLLATAGALMAAAALPGCGFALRQTPPLPFARIHLTGFDSRSPLAAELRAALTDAVQLVPTPGQADVVLQALTDRRERSVVASTAAGQVRELQLRLRFEFRVATPGGRMLVAPSELMLSRDMSYSERHALAKAQEEDGLYAAMQSDIVQQVLRRLVRADPAARAGAGLPAPAPAARP